eukprot:COSAG05_NODE_3491_length_2029_cov_1.277720_2_plen_203_part_01
MSFHAVTMIGWGHDNITGLDYWTARNSWSDNWGEDHLNPMANCSNGECGFFRITRDYTDPVTNRTHNSCQMNWHSVAGLAEIPGSCAACNSAQRPDDTDYCRCAMASAGKMPTCAVSGRPCAACCQQAFATSNISSRVDSSPLPRPLPSPPSPPPPSLKQCLFALHPGIRLDGADHLGPQLNASSAAACCELCVLRPGCQAFE